MSYLQEPINVQTPNFTQEQLVDHLVDANRTPRLKGIQSVQAIFISQIMYPITNKTKAQYKVITLIPLNHAMFQSDQLIEYVFPSRVVRYVQFIFETYTNN